MKIERYCQAEKVYQLQILVKQFNLRWIFNPYPANASKVDGEWRVGIDYNGVSSQVAKAFDLAWQRIETPIVESTRLYSITHKAKVFFKSLVGK